MSGVNSTPELVERLVAAAYLLVDYADVMLCVCTNECPLPVKDRSTSLLQFQKNYSIISIKFSQSFSNSHHQAAFMRLMVDPGLLVGTLAEGIARTLQQKYVYMDTDLYLYHNIDCRHFVLPGSEFQASTSIAFKKDSPLIPILNSVCVYVPWHCYLRWYCQ